MREIYSNYKQFRIIIGFTFLWIFFILFLISIQKDGFDWCFLVKVNYEGLTLNEWGDFSAGFIAPLALGWLAYSIYYQKKEFENVKVVFVDQQTILNEQLNQVEMQRIYMWYDRNIKKLSDNILKIENENINNNFSLELINDDFTLPT